MLILFLIQAILGLLDNVQIAENNFVTVNDIYVKPIAYNKLGARVLTEKINLYLIYYGNFTALQMDIIQTFLNGIDSSHWFNILKKYFSMTGSSRIYVNGPVSIAKIILNNYSLGKNLNGNMVPALIQSYIDKKILPEDSNGIYMVTSSPDVMFSIQNEQGNLMFCRDFCGYHKSFALRSSKVIQYIQTGNPATKCLAKCSAKAARSISPNNDVGVDALISVLAHLISETITDAHPEGMRGWEDSDGKEVADKCLWNYGESFKTPNKALANILVGNRSYYIQNIWDPSTQKCAQASFPLSADQCDNLRISYNITPTENYGNMGSSMRSHYILSNCDSLLCFAWKQIYNVTPLTDYGTLPTKLKNIWNLPKMNCDYRIGPYSILQCYTAVTMYDMLPGISTGVAPNYVVSQFAVSKCSDEICKIWMLFYQVKSTSMGKLPEKYVASWNALKCGKIVGFA